MNTTPTDFGFEWGPVQVIRCFSDQKSGEVCVRLKTKSAMVDVYVRKGGKMHFCQIGPRNEGEWIGQTLSKRGMRALVASKRVKFAPCERKGARP